MSRGLPIRSLVLRCDPDGVVREILTSDLRVPRHRLIDHPFATLLDATSHAKGLALLDAVRRGQSVSGLELLVHEPAHLQVLTFAATRVDDEILIAGSSTAAGCRRTLAGALDRSGATSRLPDPGQGRFAPPESLTEQDFNYMTELNNELTSAHRELAKTNAELARANEQKNRLLGAAVHDLRSPLSVIAGYTRMLRRRAGSRLEERERQILEMMESSIEYMSSLIAELLSVAELDSVELHLAPEEVGLSTLVERISGAQAVIAEQKGIKITCRPVPEDVRVVADAAKLNQVLNNLLGNAVKFSPAGSRIEVALDVRGKEVVISVADQGPGLSSEDRDALFRPFARTRNKPTAGETSTGLGLWIARRIVEGHRGRIWVEERPGGGSVFRFSLPLRLSESPTATRN